MTTHYQVTILTFWVPSFQKGQRIQLVRYYKTDDMWFLLRKITNNFKLLCEHQCQSWERSRP